MLFWNSHHILTYKEIWGQYYFFYVLDPLMLILLLLLWCRTEASTIPTAFCDLWSSLDFLGKAFFCISNLLICICLTFLHGVFSHETHSASIFLFPTLLSSFQKNTSIALLQCPQLIESKIQLPIGLHQIKDLNLWFSKANNTNKTPLQQW